MGWRFGHGWLGAFLWRDQRGTTALEFALVAWPFLLLVFLTFEATWAMTIELALNDAVQEASRLGSLGTLPSSGTREDSIKNAIVTRAAGLLDSNNLFITMSSYGTASQWSDNRNNKNVSPTAGAGSSRWLVQYVVTYTQPVLTLLGSSKLGGATSIVHSMTIMVQNEPF